MVSVDVETPRRIRVLPDQLANMIAAGEVVERPSNVLKELVENALDAGATHIDVELVAGGRRLVQVSDDGCGMNADDAVLCFERHATSKIASTSDLDSIHSYGFRGEALPSIAAVSRVTLQTCPDDDGVGTEVVIHGGQLRSVREVGRARGTSMVVRDLFYNTPARRKFVRTDATELRYAVREITGLGLGSPKLAFSLAHGGRMLIECHPAQTWQERAQSLFGREILLRSVEIDASGEGMHLFGLLGRPGDAGGGYSEQYLLVNARPVQSRIFRKAVLDGYEATLESGRLPFFILFLDLDPAEVDVNVHPQKREVRFRDDRATFAFIRNAVRDAFAEAGANEPSVAPGSLALPADEHRGHDADRDAHEPADKPARRTAVPHFFGPKVTGPAAQGDSTIRRPETPSAPEEQPGRVADGEPAYRAEAPQEEQEVPAPAPAPKRGKRAEEDAQLALNLVSRDRDADRADASDDEREAESHLWQFQNKYLFASTSDGLWIIDQHIAHERILYEEAMAAFAGERPGSQRLLFPLSLELSPEQDAILDEVLPMLESMGFGIQRMSGRTVLLDAYPSSVESWADGQLLREMIDELAEVGAKRTGIKEQIAASYACHAAVKAGDPLTRTKMRWLIERLFTTSMPYVCPHGRPIIVKIPMSEFDSRFGRA